MTSPELREQTASEPLTIEEEYEMCEKWRVDDDSESLNILNVTLLCPREVTDPSLLRRTDFHHTLQ
jgi:hypothetical protein